MQFPLSSANFSPPTCAGGTWSRVDHKTYRVSLLSTQGTVQSKRQCTPSLQINIKKRRHSRFPSIAMASEQPRYLYEWSNDSLAIAARDSNAHDVHQERLIREIMAVEEVEYPQVSKSIEEA